MDSPRVSRETAGVTGQALLLISTNDTGFQRISTYSSATDGNFHCSCLYYAATGPPIYKHNEEKLSELRMLLLLGRRNDTWPCGDQAGLALAPGQLITNSKKQ